MENTARPLAVVTGASTGIGRELAKRCAEAGFDLVVAADEPAINSAAAELRALGAAVDAVEADLSTTEGVDKLYAAVSGRPVEALLANAGRGLGKGFLDQTAALDGARSNELETPVRSWTPTSPARSTWSRRSAATCGRGTTGRS
jgi:short-subunit dehydrogenase